MWKAFSFVIARFDPCVILLYDPQVLGELQIIARRRRVLPDGRSPSRVKSRSAISYQTFSVRAFHAFSAIVSYC